MWSDFYCSKFVIHLTLGLEHRHLVCHFVFIGRASLWAMSVVPVLPFCQICIFGPSIMPPVVLGEISRRYRPADLSCNGISHLSSSLMHDTSSFGWTRPKLTLKCWKRLAMNKKMSSMFQKIKRNTLNSLYK